MAETEIHEGHWEYEGESFEDEIEMAGYVVYNEPYHDPAEFERWLDKHYDASDIARMLRETQYSQSVLIDLEDDYNEWRVDEAEPAEPGKDYEFDGFTFKWVEDDDEDEEVKE